MIHVKRREGFETNAIIQEKGKSLFIETLYRPPDSRMESNDKLYTEGKEIILMGDFNKYLCIDHFDTYLLNYMLSLGLNQLIYLPTRIKSNSHTPYLNR